MGNKPSTGAGGGAVAAGKGDSSTASSSAASTTTTTTTTTQQTKSSGGSNNNSGQREPPKKSNPPAGGGDSGKKHSGSKSGGGGGGGKRRAGSSDGSDFSSVSSSSDDDDGSDSGSSSGSESPGERWRKEELAKAEAREQQRARQQQQQRKQQGNGGGAPNNKGGSAAAPAGAASPPSAAADEADSIPLDLKPEDIHLGEFLGDGVYSEVFKGTVYGTPVAVKKFKNQGFDPNVLKEVRKEVRIMKSIRHPNLLLFLGACVQPGQLMIVTELMAASFHELIGRNIPVFQKILMAKEAAKGLSWLHSLTPVIIHRDLKPENILVSEDYRSVKVADFGLSLVRDNSSAMLEEMKKIRGSPAFMSPEALLAHHLTPATDVYSFGMIMWELITEGSPYENLRIESFEQLIDEICEKNTRETLPKNTLPALRKVIESSWSPSPETRPTFLQVISALDDALLEHAIEDVNGRLMWERCFRTESDGVQISVPFAKFQNALEYHVDVGISTKLWRAVQGMMLVEQDTQGRPGPVHIQNFGNLLRWFGPMEVANTGRPEQSFLARMQQLFTFRWFHGDITTEQAETRLSEGKPGTFLVRFSSRPGQWALSKVVQVDDDPEPKTLHVRIQTRRRDGNREFVLTLAEETYTFSSLPELVQSPVLELGDACAGSKYFATFRVKQDHLGYVN